MINAERYPLNFSLENLPPSDPGPFGVGASRKPTFTTEQAGKHITRDSLHFHDRNGDKRVDLSYTVDPQFSAAQQRRVRQAAQSWEDVANISFKERAAGADGTVHIKNNPRVTVASPPHPRASLPAPRPRLAPCEKVVRLRWAATFQ